VRDLRLSEAARSDPAMPALAFMNDHHAYLSLMLELARADRDRFDIIHNHSLHYLPVAHAAALPTPMICTLHTPPTPWLESAITASTGAGVQFVAVSRHTAGMCGGGPLVWFGRITLEKGPHLAIDAARQAGRPLVLAGPRSDVEYFDSEVAPRLTERIRYVGHLPHTELAALVGRSAAALVTPMWDEPYGLVVAEALSCGTPVVAFARGGIPEIVDADCGRLVAPGDASAMAAAIAEAVTLPRDRVRRRALQRCSASTMLARYVTIYHRTIGSQKAKSHARLLHSSQRSGTSRARDQHSHPTAAAGHCADVGPAAPASSLPLGGAAAARRCGPVG